MAEIDKNKIVMSMSYHKQLLDRQRIQVYNNQIKFQLLVKMLEEKGVMAPGELEKRWPLYLKNDIGAVGPDKVMAGSLKVTFYN